MEKFDQDPIQESFSKKLKESGVNFNDEQENRKMTTEEWFLKYYQGEKKEELPPQVLANDSEGKINELIKEHREKEKNNSEKSIDQQTEIDFPQ